jgi:hypothetical protein
MDLNAAKRMADQLVALHGLDKLGWTFSFDNSRRRFGLCSYGPKTISQSRHLAALNDEARCRNNVLHEIAHALLPPGVHHGPAWVRKAREIGCDGIRCFSSSEVAMPTMAFTGRCPGCTATISKSRIPRRGQACRSCCKRHNGGRFDLRFVFNWARSTSAVTVPVRSFTPPPFAPPTYVMPVLTPTATAKPLTRYAIWKAKQLAKAAA